LRHSLGVNPLAFFRHLSRRLLRRISELIEGTTAFVTQK
jgi:hypothetical protein